MRHKDDLNSLNITNNECFPELCDLNYDSRRNAILMMHPFETSISLSKKVDLYYCRSINVFKDNNEFGVSTGSFINRD